MNKSCNNHTRPSVLQNRPVVVVIVMPQPRKLVDPQPHQSSQQPHEDGVRETSRSRSGRHKQWRDGL